MQLDVNNLRKLCDAMRTLHIDVTQNYEEENVTLENMRDIGIVKRRVEDIKDVDIGNLENPREIGRELILKAVGLFEELPLNERANIVSDFNSRICAVKGYYFRTLKERESVRELDKMVKQAWQRKHDMDRERKREVELRPILC